MPPKRRARFAATGGAPCTRLGAVLTSPTLRGRFVQLEPLAPATSRSRRGSRRGPLLVRVQRGAERRRGGDAGTSRRTSSSRLVGPPAPVHRAPAVGRPDRRCDPFHGPRGLRVAAPLATGRDRGARAHRTTPHRRSPRSAGPGTRRRRSGPSSTPSASCLLLTYAFEHLGRPPRHVEDRRPQRPVARRDPPARCSLRGDPPCPCAGGRRRGARHRLLLDRCRRMAGGSRPPGVDCATGELRSERPRAGLSSAPGPLPRVQIDPSSRSSNACRRSDSFGFRAEAGRRARRSPHTLRRARPPGAPAGSRSPSRER